MLTIEQLELELGETLLERAQKRSYSRGEPVYHRGAKPQGFFYIVEGLVGLVNISANGHESLLRVFGCKNFFGHRSFLAQENYHATSVVIKPAKILFLSMKDPQMLYDQCPALFLTFSAILAKELRNAEDRLLDFSGKKVTGRIIEALLYLKHKQADYNWTRKEIGEFSGAQTETVTRVLSQLEQDGLILKDGREIQVPNEDALFDYMLTVDN